MGKSEKDIALIVCSLARHYCSPSIQAVADKVAKEYGIEKQLLGGEPKPEEDDDNTDGPEAEEE